MLIDAVRTGAVAELVWHSGDEVHVATATPLLAGDRVTLALPMSRTPLVDQLRRADQVLLALTDHRPTRPGWAPAAALVAVDVELDRTGDAYIDDGLLGDELDKSPALRLMLDTPILRREHWWLMPRWLVRLTALSDVAAPRRAAPSEGLAVSWPEGGPSLAAVRPDWDADPMSLGIAPWELPDGPGLVCTHDWADPDRAHQHLCVRAGRVDGAQLHVRRRSGEPGKPRLPGLLARLRAQRHLERACRAQLAAVESER